ncbi:DUF4262 domain-containing protein [Mycolicibacterium hodleri]|uniref:DUF4262 domain-containing protein n=1 Tax=Mycolicibacterium hodleri TaxID=49897 RepID=A0A502DX88_9MYCO|nr:DUF4262 domain-containing protein [Mycolicibacterium hodleri]TPG29724.1 DUF4262 domain-containing protein [Mycolicibacterium hodleri]
MCWQCDHPEKTLDDYLTLLRGKILDHGWVVQCVEDKRRPFAYTIGLHYHGLPELLVTGLPPKRARWLLNTFAKRALTGRQSGPGDQVSLPAGTRLELVEVEHPDAHMGMAIAIEGTDLTAVQLVWADGRGRWPWALGFDDGHRSQPVLGARSQHA